MCNNADNLSIKLIEQIKDFFIFFYEKPLHTILIGIICIFTYFYLCKSIKILFIGIVMFAFAIGTIVERCYTKSHYKKQILAYYDELPEKEKEIIDYCLENNSLAFRPDVYTIKEYTESIYSLVCKGFGTNISSGDDFLMPNFAYQLLKSINK